MGTTEDEIIHNYFQELLVLATQILQNYVSTYCNIHGNKKFHENCKNSADKSCEI